VKSDEASRIVCTRGSIDGSDVERRVAAATGYPSHLSDLTNMCHTSKLPTRMHIVHPAAIKHTSLVLLGPSQVELALLRCLGRSLTC